MPNTHAFPVGSKVKIGERWTSPPSGLSNGTTYTVESVRTSGVGDRPLGFLVRLEGKGSEYGSDWFVYAEQPERERIPFSLTKTVSQGYAFHQKSRNLTPEQNQVLQAASEGAEVDAIDFRKAVTAALSLAATRAGQSMARREWTKECRHLLYIVDAVLDNAYLGLPPVDAGTRSPKIAEQKREIEDLRNTVSRLAGELQQTQFNVDTEKARVGALIVEKTDAEAQVARLKEAGSRKSTQMEYAMSLLDDQSRFKVVGFGDAVSWLA
jgi:hypothetical protein